MLMDKKPCSVDSCSRVAVARGWCSRHWVAWRKYGDPLARKSAKGLTLLETVVYHGWEEMPTGCWEWCGPRNKDNYGRMQVGGTTVGAHRVIYAIHNGPIPDGLLIRHTCDNPPCVNPKHLVSGTPKDNMQDKVDRGRSNFPTGERAGAAKLVVAQVLEVRELSRLGWSYPKIASKFQISVSNVECIVNRKTWRYV